MVPQSGGNYAVFISFPDLYGIQARLETCFDFSEAIPQRLTHKGAVHQRSGMTPVGLCCDDFMSRMALLKKHIFSCHLFREAVAMRLGSDFPNQLFDSVPRKIPRTDPYLCDAAEPSEPPADLVEVEPRRSPQASPIASDVTEA